MNPQLLPILGAQIKQMDDELKTFIKFELSEFEELDEVLGKALGLKLSFFDWPRLLWEGIGS